MPIRTFRVMDGKGNTLTVFEDYDGWFVRKVNGWKLSSGERLGRSSDDTFAVLGTGEELLVLD